MPVITVSLQKGGVGKSTTAQAIAENLGANHKVLLIDLDSQGNVTYSSGVDTPALTITDVLGYDCSPADALIPCAHYDLLAADDYLTNVERDAQVPPTLLRETIASIRNQYEYIIIDTPPALGNLSLNALVASDYVIIPTDSRPYAMQGISKLCDTVQSVQKALNPALKVLGILLVKYHSRSVLNRDIRDMIADYAKQMNTKIFETSIRESIAVPEAQTVRQSLNDYAPKSKPAADYKALASEIERSISHE